MEDYATTIINLVQSQDSGSESEVQISEADSINVVPYIQENHIFPVSTGDDLLFLGIIFAIFVLSLLTLLFIFSYKNKILLNYKKRSLNAYKKIFL